MMIHRTVAATLSAIAIASTLAGAASAATVPCEDMLKQLRDAKATANPSPADKQKADELEAKGLERCKADDDKRADQFFAEAMKALGK